MEEIRRIDSQDNADTVPDVLTLQALQDWAESRSATIDLLGIRVSVDDAPVLGTISLFVVSLWLLLVTRRENHTVGSLLRDTDTPGGDTSSSLAGSSQLPDIEPRQLYSNGQRWLIFHSVFANNLFVTFDRWSQIDSLRNPNALAHDGPTAIKRKLDRLSMSFARNFFFWFPVAASSFVFALDRMSYFFLEDPFAPELRPPGWEAPWFFASALVFVVCWVPLVICCRGAARYSRATGNVLRDTANACVPICCVETRAKRRIWGPECQTVVGLPGRYHDPPGLGRIGNVDPRLRERSQFSR